MTPNRFKSVFLVVLAWSLTMISQVALASQSKAQLYMPWPMLNTKLNNVLSGSNSSFSTKVPVSTLDAGGIIWSITNTEYTASTNTPVSHTNGSVIDFQAHQSVLKVTIQKIAVDQIIERVINGATVRIHLIADCGPLTFTQPNASAASTFNIDWSSGSPAAVLKSSELAWVQNSWLITPFTCTGPEGLPDILKQQISDRLQNADDFKPYLTEFVSKEVQTRISDTLNKIREPLTVKAASTRQTFKVGTLYNLPQGVIADLTMSDVVGASALPAAQLPSADVLNSLSTTTPSFLAGKDLLEQLIRGELTFRAASMKSDLQNNAAFHALMQDRLKQTFGWSDLTKYPKNSPFPVTIFKPNFDGMTVGTAGTLSSTFNLNGVVQSYRDSRWWPWLVIGGKTAANVKVTVSNGKVAYNTSLAPVNTTIDYSTEYKTAFKKDGHPPSDKIINAVTGQQPTLSGSFTFPIVELANTGAYKVSGLKWINPQNFVLNWIAK